MGEVECPKCGKHVSEGSLTVHEDSRPCIARRTKQSYEKNGYVRLQTKKYISHLKREDYPYEYDIYDVASRRDAHNDYKEGYWVKEKVRDKIIGEVIPGPDACGGEKVDENEEDLVVRFIHKDDFYYVYAEKDNTGKTQKRKFRVRESILDTDSSERPEFYTIYDNSGYRFGDVYKVEQHKIELTKVA